MIPENETSTPSVEIPIELPEKVPALPTVEPDIPDFIPEKVVTPITDVSPDEYIESVNNLVAKYTKK